MLREAGLIRQYYVGTSDEPAAPRFDEAFPGLLDARTGQLEKKT
ncbi:hypothetical protein Pth03_18050 [Planotetraspora thailandica]|uniref:Uncharacterized protein n=1 Tax=Planotetraspora thailandica TaxID=487172 RepID=A0A8J3V1N7_9ACTN|nr:hypothetical protein Pth03_18050 [Planotetraspora thailandica]